MVYQLESNRVLDSYLGLKWDERILNVAGDFAYVIPGTIKYWLGQRSPIIEYKLIGEQYARTQVENSNFITFQFVRGDGNRNNYSRTSIIRTSIIRTFSLVPFFHEY